MIFFDIDGTLLDHKGAEAEGVKKFYNMYDFEKQVDFEGFKNVWVTFSDKNFDKFLRKECTFEEQRANRIIEVFNEVGMSISYEDALKKFDDYLKAYEESWKAYDDVIPGLEELKDEKLGIISNGDHEQQLLKLSKIGIDKYFSDVITAGLVGVAKPESKIFEIACERNNVKASNSYYIGDVIKTDIIPCEKIGMKGILIDRDNKNINNVEVTRVSSLVDLKNVINFDCKSGKQ